MRRHRRNLDPFQVRENFERLWVRLKNSVSPEAISDDDFRRILYAVQYFERHPAKASKSGRRARFDATFLFNSALKLKGVLQAQSGGRISLQRLIPTYLPILKYPPDIRKALDRHQINLEEARMLARINRKNLGEAVKRAPSEIRRELIESHLKRQGTQNELKERVDQRLNLTPKKQAQNLSANIAVLDANNDKFLEFDESDTEHLLWEEIKGLVFLMREVDSAILDEETIDQILKDLDSIKLRLLKFRKIVDEDDSEQGN